MVNHVRTLLFNANSVEAESVGAPYVDPSFVPLSLDGNLLACTSVLFGGGGLSSRLKTVDFLMSVLLSPEFSGFLESFDARIMSDLDERVVAPGTVSGFYGSLDPNFDTGIVESLLSDRHTQFLFQHVANPEVDSRLDSLYLIYTGSFETWRRFAAAVYAIVYRLDMQYEESR